MSTSFILVIIVICVLLSSFFSASEMSLSSCSRVRLEHMAENGNRAAGLAVRILDHFDSALSAILLGNNLVNIAASSLGSIAAIRLAGAGYTWVSTLILTVVVIIVGETIPKILAERNATRLSLHLARPVRILMVVFRPLTFIIVGFVNLVTKPLKSEDNDGEMGAEELHSIIETAEDEDVLDEETSELVSAAIDFSGITAQEVMTARVDMVTIDLGDSPEEIRELIESASVSRLPVYEDDIDHIIGILHVNHYLKALSGGEEPEIRGLLLPVTHVYKAMKLPAVLTELQKGQQQLAIVTDEYGGTLGLVSVEDILEELVGEIWDETDIVEAEIEPRADGSIDVDGDMLFSDFAEYMEWNSEEDEFESDTVGGWCIEMLGGFPEAGETFSYKDVKITVTEVEERRVRRVHAAREKSAE